MPMEFTSLLMAVLVRPRRRKEVRVTPVATKRAILEGTEMKNPRQKFRCRSILSISQGPTIHLPDRIPTEEDATKAEEVGAGEIVTIGSTIGGLVDLVEVETAGVVEGGLQKGIKATRLSEGWSRVSSNYRVSVTCFPLRSTVLLANRVVILDLH